MTQPVLSPAYQVVQVAQPAAGAEFTLRATGQGAWRVLSLAFTLATSAVVANRRIALLADDGTDVWGAFPSANDQAASLNMRYGAHDGAVSNAFGGTAWSIPLPATGLLLLPGHRLRSTTLNIDVADQYSAVRALVREFLLGEAGRWGPGPAPTFILSGE